MQMNNANDGENNKSVGVVNQDDHSPQEIQVANYSRKQAFDYLKKSQFGRALAHLFVSLRLIPEWRNELHDVFCHSLSAGCRQLQNEGRLNETIQLRKDSLLLYPDDGILLMDLGSVYFKLDDIDHALQYYQQAIQVCPNLLPAFRALQSIYNKQVERWHFRMLNDLDRNEAYYKAIAYRIQEGYLSVLDVGTGTGLLSLYAAENGAKTIWACESKTSMFKIAQSVLAANSTVGAVNLLNKHSNVITIPADIPKKVSLLVTEVFDAGLLGEGVLPMLLYAWENLLTPPLPGTSGKEKSVVVPFSATVWAVPIQCIDIARRYRLLPASCLCNGSGNASSLDGTVSDRINFGETSCCKLCEAPCDEQERREEYFSYHLDDTPVAYTLCEPYTTEDLGNIPFGFEMLSKPYKVLEINFNNIEELKSYNLKRVAEKVVPVKIESMGSVDAIASWFHLNLDNQGTIISSAPFKEDGLYQGVCWHQAIFPSSVPRKGFPGDVMKLHVSAQDDMLKIFEKEIHGPQLLVSQDIIQFLNNKTWIKALLATAVSLVSSCSSNRGSSKQILDLNPFPIIGMQMLKKCDSNWKLFAKAETRTDEIYITTVARKNCINVGQLEFVTEDSLENDVKGKSFDVICVNVMDSSGELTEKITELLILLQDKLTSSGTIVPNLLSVQCQLIESERLIQMSRVISDKNTRNFKIREFINCFAVDYHIDVSQKKSDFKLLSKPFEIFSFDLNSSECNSMCCQLSKDISVNPTEAGTASGIIYWVNLYLLSDSKPISTACYDSHCNQAVLFSSQCVEPGTEVGLKCQYWYGMMDVKFLNANL